MNTQMMKRGLQNKMNKMKTSEENEPSTSAKKEVNVRNNKAEDNYKINKK